VVNYLDLTNTGCRRRGVMEGERELKLESPQNDVAVTHARVTGWKKIATQMGGNFREGGPLDKCTKAYTKNERTGKDRGTDTTEHHKQ